LDIEQYMQTLGGQARAASRLLSRASTADKNQALMTIAQEIRAQAEGLKSENALDLANGKEKGLDTALLDRLELTDSRIESMA